MGWIIDVKGAQLREEDVKMAHVSVANAALGIDTWDAVDPMSSPSALTVWCAVALAEATGQDMDLTLMFVQSLPLQEVVGCYIADGTDYVSPHVQTEVDREVAAAATGPDPATQQLLDRAALAAKE